MSSKVFFENKFKQYAPNSEIVNFDSDGKVSSLNSNFLKRIETFQAQKLNYLTTELKEAIFYDGTVYTGSAGLALYYFTKSLKSTTKQQDEHHHLLNILPYLNLGNLKGKRITFLCGDAGPLALATVISYKLKSTQRHEHLPDYESLAQRLLSLLPVAMKSPDELLYGKSGYLYALLFVNKYIGKEVIKQKYISEVANGIITSGRQLASQSHAEAPLMWEWHDKMYLGAAHGFAGILYMLLQARSYISKEDLKKLVKPTIDWLMEQRFTSGNFPSSLGSSSGDRLVQWCHGAPGFVPLCILASEVFPEDKNKYMKIALDCGDVVWERGLCAKGYSICHGVSGNAYAFLQLYQTTKEPMHLYRACCFMDWCMSERAGTQRHYPDRPASLFEGLVGPLYLAQDLIHPDQAKFPAMCL